MVKLSGKLTFSTESRRKKPILNLYQPHFHINSGLYSGVILLLRSHSVMPGETALADVEILNSAVTPADFAPGQIVEFGEADCQVGIFIVTRIISS